MDYRPYYPPVLTTLSRVIDYALVLSGAFIVTLVFVNATLRSAAGFDLAWSLEVTAFLLLWSTFLGCAAAVARGAHMRVTEIVDSLLPRSARYHLSTLINLIVALMMISLVVTGYSISTHTWAQRTTVLYLPVGFLYASMPAGMLLCLVFHLFNTVIDVKHSNDPTHPSRPSPDTGTEAGNAT
ncbi:TRAP transporter small permease [Granulosicoccus sp. 3-233]|uniref:TRAP transporter small permease n=1 Tax=Granulosicoccus sp. 3-233 TaxID=3417969 RepID=UPI003D3473E5